ncbi:MAG TPA: dTDP-4-dehydrorhamnose reductase [Beijerinckiaceae bacterium]|nr:dTDP-4-dehydrorhamnose reductase [Beijerinckiaceae bacterium]
MRRPIVLFGAGGQLGRELCESTALATGEIVGFTRADVDITDFEAVAASLARVKPRLVVNAAAYTTVDKAEADPEGAFAANAVGPQKLAAAAKNAAVPIIHLSTDYVFDGTKTGAYVEGDPIAPIGVYGHSKADGEACVRAATPHHVIIRTAWVYGVYGANFLKTMLRLAAEREELRVVADQRGCPTATLDIAAAIFAVDRHIAGGGQPWGTYHFAGTGVTTWHGFACAIVEAARPYLGKRPKVTAIASQDYPTPARRPANSELDSSRFAAIFGHHAAPWQERTREVVGRLLSSH